MIVTLYTHVCRSRQLYSVPMISMLGASAANQSETVISLGSTGDWFGRKSPEKFYKGSQEENTSPMAGFFLNVEPVH